MMDLRVDPARKRPMHMATGIYVRAVDGETWGAYDVAQLDAASFEALIAMKDRQWILDALRLTLGYPVWPAYEGIAP